MARPRIGRLGRSLMWIYAVAMLGVWGLWSRRMSDEDAHRHQAEHSSWRESFAPMFDWLFPPYVERVPKNETMQGRMQDRTSLVSGGDGDVEEPIDMDEHSLRNVYMPDVHDMPKFDLHPLVPHVGVLVDAGRHFFPIRWLKVLIDYLEKIQFTMIHLRLTDDQSFAVRFHSHPTLVMPAPKDTRFYTPEDLKDLVDYASQRGIMIVPEINVPGHAAAWHGIPGLVMPCPRFTCTWGYGVPLNVTNPHLITVLYDILKEVKEIFHTSPYLHLGGDEVHLSEPCFQELDVEIPDYNTFESELERILKEIGIPLDHVLRWERPVTEIRPADVSNDTEIHHAGEMTHYWIRKMNGLPSNTFPKPFFASTGLYMDTNEDDRGWDIYQKTKTLVEVGATGIVVGTFELHPKWWEDRNVWGRLIAVSMGASQELVNVTNATEFDHLYETYCSSVGLEKDICELLGAPKVPTVEWRSQWERHWKWWKVNICDRLTDPTTIRAMKVPNPIGISFQTRQAEEIHRARTIFLNRFHDKDRKRKPKQSYAVNAYGKFMASDESYRTYKPQRNPEALFRHTVGHTGVMVDTARFFFPLARLKKITEWLSLLGFNTLHLRMTDDYAFSMKLQGHPDMSFATKKDGSVYTDTGLAELVTYAEEMGVEVIPEINVVSRGGGWFAGDFVSPCPNHICSKGYGIPLNLTNIPMLAVASNVIEESRLIFNSPFLHLGYDEREESLACFEESRIKDVDFDAVERKLMAVMSVLQIPSRHVIRWESSDSEKDPDRQRAGVVTHYHLTDPPNETEHPFFVSTELRFDELDHHQNDDAWKIYQKARGYSQHKNVLGILGGTMEMSPQAWNALNMHGRLLAMAIGVSTKANDDMTEDQFREIYTQACEDLDLEPETCKLYGKPRLSADYWENLRIDQRVQRINNTCNRLTGWSHSRIAKPSILGN